VPRDLRDYIVRLVLGTVFGVAIGFFTSGDGNTAQQVIAAPVSSLGALALAFLAGPVSKNQRRNIDTTTSHEATSAD
jgi:hypothetical protein